MKRFTESSKWNDPWFRKLSLTHKLYWLWLLDNCDCAGIIEPDLELARFMLGASEGLPSPKEAFGDRIEQAGEKFLILKFIRYQYGDSLNPANNAHRGVLKRLESSEFKGMKHLFDSKNKESKLAPSEGLVRSCQAPQDKEQDKDKDKDQEKDQESKSKARGTIEEFRAFAAEIQLPESDGEHMFHHLSESGWKRGKDQIKDWKATVRKWKTGGWLPSQKVNPSQSQSKPRYSNSYNEDIQLP